MFTRTLRFFTMLAAAVALLAGNGESRQSVLIPAQTRETKNLGIGRLLVSSRGLADPIFAEKVILLVHYDQKGALGLMLNRRTEVPLSKVLESVKAAKNLSDPVYLGGPVETPTAFALLQSSTPPEGAEHVFGKVYLISNKTTFEQTLAKRPESSNFHVYLGYAGWTPEQLRKEVELGVWYIFPADTKTVFDSDPDSLWPRMIQKTELKLARSRAANTGRAYGNREF